MILYMDRYHNAEKSNASTTYRYEIESNNKFYKIAWYIDFVKYAKKFL